MNAATPNSRLEIAATLLVSAAMLGIQIRSTRIFSIMIGYHFAFLVISTAMLGFTVGGLLLDLHPHFLSSVRARGCSSLARSGSASRARSRC